MYDEVYMSVTTDNSRDLDEKSHRIYLLVNGSSIGDRMVFYLALYNIYN